MTDASPPSDKAPDAAHASRRAAIEAFLAEWSVFLGVLSFVLAVVIALWAAGTWLFAAFKSIFEPRNRALALQIELSVTAFAVAATLGLGALANLVLHIMRERRLAGLAVAVAAALSVVVAIVGALTINPGPQSYVVYAGTRAYDVPWVFNPKGSETLGADAAFTVHICLESGAGQFKKRCDAFSYVTVTPLSDAAMRSVEFMRWDNGEKLAATPAEPAFEHTQFLLPDDGAAFLIADDAGLPYRRFIYCYRVHDPTNVCLHHVVIDDLLVIYTLPYEQTALWRETDRKLAKLMTKWRTPQVRAN